MSLIDEVPRSATCSVRTNAVLLEIVRAPCEQLIRSGSTLALKFLATLNEGLISALRGADLRLMQLEGNEGQANLGEMTAPRSPRATESSR
jgi:hypothetical protein